jgi:predicted transcriptional regulator
MAVTCCASEQDRKPLTRPLLKHWRDLFAKQLSPCLQTSTFAGDQKHDRRPSQLQQLRKPLLTDEASNNDVVELTAEIISAYISNNAVAVSALPQLISDVHAALARLSGSRIAEAEQAAPQAPAVSIRKSITPDFIICLEDGKKFKSLKRHIRTAYDLTPEQYREKWGLSADYPMVAPAYAATRSALAKNMGLGQSRTKAKVAAMAKSKGSAKAG